MKTQNVILAAVLFAAPATMGQAGNLLAAYLEPVVTAPAGVAGISVSVCDDEPGHRRGCDGGDRKAAFATAPDRDTPEKTASRKEPKGGGKSKGEKNPKGDKTPKGEKPIDTVNSPAPEKPVDVVDTDKCDTCVEWQKEYQWKRENKPWLDNPKWSAERRHPNAPKNRGESMWDRCIGSDRFASRRQ